jgi:hypothetical protein
MANISASLIGRAWIYVIMSDDSFRTDVIYRLMHALFLIRTVIIQRNRYRLEGFSPRVDILVIWALLPLVSMSVIFSINEMTLILKLSNYH